MKTFIALLTVALFSLSAGQTYAQDPAPSGNPVQVITAANDYAEMDQMPQALIQLCLKEYCPSQLATLKKLAPEFPNVTFVQMSAADNSVFAKRIESEQQVSKESQRNWFVRLWRAGLRSVGLGGQPDAIEYPIYLFKGADLNVAPDIANTHQLKQFIKMNASYAEDGASPPAQPGS